MSEAIVEPVAPVAARTEADGFEALYRRAFPRVYAYVASLIGERAAAEDATALAFERAYRAIRRRRREAALAD